MGVAVIRVGTDGVVDKETVHGNAKIMSNHTFQAHHEHSYSDTAAPAPSKNRSSDIEFAMLFNHLKRGGDLLMRFLASLFHLLLHLPHFSRFYLVRWDACGRGCSTRSSQCCE